MSHIDICPGKTHMECPPPFQPRTRMHAPVYFRPSRPSTYALTDKNTYTHTVKKKKRHPDDVRGQVRTNADEGNGISRLQIDVRSIVQGGIDHDEAQIACADRTRVGLLRRHGRIRAERRGGEFDGVRIELGGGQSGGGEG
jgi:hypothetical protein